MHPEDGDFEDDEPLPGTPVLETARLLLRPFTEIDEAEHAVLWAKPELVRFFQPEGEKAIRHAARNANTHTRMWAFNGERGGLAVFAVIERASGRFIGHLGLRINRDLETPELTLMLDNAVWGRGYATEAGIVALGYHFAKFELDEVVAVVMEGNAASHRVMQKLGFAPAGPHQQWNMIMSLYRLTIERWRACLGESKRSF